MLLSAPITADFVMIITKSAVIGALRSMGELHVLIADPFIKAVVTSPDQGLEGAMVFTGFP